MKRFIGAAACAALLTIVACLTSGYFVIGGAVSVNCDFVGSGRGYCQASPANPSYNYDWWASGGASVSVRNSYAVSAACGGTYATVYVTVTDGSGNLIGTSHDDASCNDN